MIPYAEQLKERQAGFGRNLQTVASTPGEEVVVVEEGKTPFAGSFKHNSVAASVLRLLKAILKPDLKMN